MLEMNFCNVLLVLAIVFILSYISYNISGNQPLVPLEEGFASSAKSSKLNNLKNHNNRKLAAVVRNNNTNARKKNNRNKIRENLENVDIQPDGSHVLDTDYIKNKIADYYHSFDHKILRKKGGDMQNFNNKLKFFKEQFWNIFE